jgi:SAM-dependent methyltransferase
MNHLVQVIRQLEDFVLSENGLAGAGYVRFEHKGSEALGFPYIRSSHQRFCRVLDRALEIIPRDNGSLRFLEVGCGLGTKCEIARWYGFEATGIDLDSQYVGLAKRLFSANRFLEANALEFDFGNQELIYYHTPLASQALMAELEQRVLGTMSCGALLCATSLTHNLLRNLSNRDDSTNRWRHSLVPVKFDEEERLYGLQKIADIPDLDLLTGSMSD